MTAFAVAMLPAFTLRINEFMTLEGLGVDSAATTLGSIAALRHLAEFFAAPTLSALSDTAGRRPVLLCSCCAFVAETAAMAMAPNLAVLAAVHVVGGLFATGGAVEASCIADSTSAGPQRAVAMGRFLTVIGGALVLGPAMGGAVAKRFGGGVPFALAALLAAATVVCQFLFLPEYLDASQRQSASRDTSRRGLKRVLPLLGLKDLLKDNCVLVWCASASMLTSLGLGMFSSTSSLWMQAAFAWEAPQLGRFLSVMGFAVMISQVVVLPWLLALAKGREVAVAQSTLVLMSFKYLSFGLAPHGTWIYVISILTLPSFCSMTLLSSLATRHVPASQQGLWSGGISALGTAAQALGSVLGSRAFAATVSMPRVLGLHLALPAGVYLIAAACIAQVDGRKQKKTDESDAGKMVATAAKLEAAVSERSIGA
eukprot:CAMPEP_0178383312 /NCGR_PEP_ID=MMETSP0689_2-20121128/6938_1 /TAXON_ID=160604 /ORGANISM="Amphidinium massartii, Strain CS-259" /LENGTH=426 /DNA_ID=CAMNT_0020003531 /DNA_START=126 /DNA_END=1406 /DNA_ORIENTATION=+